MALLVPTWLTRIGYRDMAPRATGNSALSFSGLHSWYRSNAQRARERLQPRMAMPEAGLKMVALGPFVPSIYEEKRCIGTGGQFCLYPILEQRRTALAENDPFAGWPPRRIIP